MNALSPASLAEPLLFSWDPPRRRKVAITAFLAASLIAHALCFYIFQVVYPPTASLLPPPARVSVISPNSEEGQTLLRWVEAEDPALAFTTQRPPGSGGLRSLPKIDHVPSYLGTEPVLKEVPPLLVDARIPSSQPAGAVPFIHRQTPPDIGHTSTSIAFSKELDAFGLPALPKPSFTASGNEAPQAVRFRIAVGGRGEIRYCFALNSSGDPALDEQARRYLMRCRFPQISASGAKVAQLLTWGVATIDWGNDVESPRQTPTGAATP
jgi:hypothetical protein